MEYDSFKATEQNTKLFLDGFITSEQALVMHQILIKEAIQAVYDTFHVKH